MMHLRRRLRACQKMDGLSVVQAPIKMSNPGGAIRAFVGNAKSISYPNKRNNSK